MLLIFVPASPDLLYIHSTGQPIAARRPFQQRLSCFTRHSRVAVPALVRPCRTTSTVNSSALYIRRAGYCVAPNIGPQLHGCHGSRSRINTLCHAPMIVYVLRFIRGIQSLGEGHFPTIGILPSCDVVLEFFSIHRRRLCKFEQLSVGQSSEINNVPLSIEGSCDSVCADIGESLRILL